MRWAILTPERSVRWDGERLWLGPGARRDQAPPADAGEKLWLTYYRSIFNPARLKLGAMQKEMPKRYWKNLPEAPLIEPLAAAAGERSLTMIARGPTDPKRRPATEPQPTPGHPETPGGDSPRSLPALRDALRALPRVPDRRARDAGGARRRREARAPDVRRRAARRPGRPARPALRRPGRHAARARPRGARRAARQGLHHERGQALQVRAARQAPHPQDAGAAGSRGLPALARERDRARRSVGAGRARRDGGAPADGHARSR